MQKMFYSILLGSVLCLFAACAGIGLAPVAAAQSDLPSNANTANFAPRSSDYGGVIVDQTITVIGQEFYKNFAMLWHEKANTERYALAIRERPSARQGSRIFIEMGQRRIFQAQLPSNRANVQALSEQAANAAYDNVVDADLQKLLLRDPDLAADEY